MQEKLQKSRKQRLADIIFETDTPAAKAFDAVLLVLILISVVLVLVESMQTLTAEIRQELYIAEWIITILFTIEYVLRLLLARHATHYARSFYGVIDLLAILPTYLELLIGHPHYLMIVRALRLMRLFRVFKLTRYVTASENIKKALFASRIKIIVFLGAILSVMMVIGATMYLIEGPENGFNNIPVAIYWAINTLTPVSASDLQAQTTLGKIFAAALMFLGYAILAIPTGIVSSEITRASLHQQQNKICPECGHGGHEPDADYCKFCATKLPKG